MKKINYVILGLMLINSGFLFSGNVSSTFLPDKSEEELCFEDFDIELDEFEPKYLEEIKVTEIIQEEKERRVNLGLELVMLTWKGDIEKIKELILDNADINVQDSIKQTSLIRAANFNRKDIVELLIKNKVNLDLRGLYGWSALLAAYHNDNVEIAKLLIKAGANLDILDESGGTLLINAAYSNDKEIIQLAIKFKVGINVQNKYGETALMAACSVNNNKEVVDLLIDNGADIYLKDKFGDNVLMISCKRGYKDLAELFIKMGIDINLQNLKGITALMQASKGKQAVKSLCKKRIQVKNKKEFRLGIKFGFPDVVKLLLNYGADINMVNKSGLQVIDIYNHVKKHSISDDIRLGFLLNNIQIKVYELFEDLTKIIKNKEEANLEKIKKIKKILSIGLYICDFAGNNALHLAAKLNDKEIFKFIIGIRPNLLNKKNYPNRVFNSGLLHVEKTEPQTPLELNPEMYIYLALNYLRGKLEDKIIN